MRVILTHLDFITHAAADNVRTLQGVLARAQALGATHVLTPEMALPGYAAFARGEVAWQDWAAGEAALAATVRETGVALWLGTARREGAAAHNAMAIYDTAGRERAVYYKQRIPKGDLEEWATAGEKELVVPDGLRLGAMICADAWHDSRAYRLSQRGLDAVWLSACWPPGCGGPPEYAWKRCAYSAGVPFLVCNQTGKAAELDCTEAESALVHAEDIQCRYKGEPALLMTDYDGAWSDFTVLPWEGV